MIYIASPFFNDEQNEFYRKSMAEIVFEPKRVIVSPNADLVERQKIFLNNVRSIDNSEKIYSFVEYPDVGTAFEIGYALQKHKTIQLVYSTLDNNPNLMQLLEFIQLFFKE